MKKEVDRRHTERGSAGTKFFITMVIIALVGNAGYNYIPVAYEAESMKSEMSTAVLQGISMPGKVNPVIPEVVNQVAFSVIGNDLTITLAAEAGQLQLNVMEPILAYCLATNLRMLTAAVNVLTTKCITGITANRERCRDLVEHSIGIVTAVMPVIGYKRATEVAKIALETGASVREIILEKGYLNIAELDEALSLEAMTQPRPMPKVDVHRQ